MLNMPVNSQTYAILLYFQGSRKHEVHVHWFNNFNVNSKYYLIVYGENNYK